MGLTSDILQKDPFGILGSTKGIAERPEFVAINKNNLNEVAKRVAGKINSGLEAAELSFGSAGKFEDDIQLVFFEDVVNFSFWSEKNQPNWSVEHPVGETASGGWYSLIACFKRALDQKIPVLDAEFMENLTLQDCKKIFHGKNNVDIPLVNERKQCLNEAGAVFKKDFGGKFINLIKNAEYDAIKIVKLIYDKFPSFQDEATFKAQKVFFLKRAQICANDISLVFGKHQKGKIKNIDALTAFADYRLPQILREYGAISYSKDLAERVDNYIQIPAASREEIEIRAATIWCVELIRQRFAKYTAAQIDNALWLLSQERADTKPHHRTRTIFY
jgi:hypothetical protein